MTPQYRTSQGQDSEETRKLARSLIITNKLTIQYLDLNHNTLKKIGYAYLSRDLALT